MHTLCTSRWEICVQEFWNTNQLWKEIGKGMAHFKVHEMIQSRNEMLFTNDVPFFLSHAFYDHLPHVQFETCWDQGLLFVYAVYALLATRLLCAILRILGPKLPLSHTRYTPLTTWTWILASMEPCWLAATHVYCAVCKSFLAPENFSFPESRTTIPAWPLTSTPPFVQV